MESGRSFTPALKRVGQRHGDLDRGIGIIALPDIQKPGNPADIAQVLVKEPELSTGQCQYDAVLGNLFHEFRIVIRPGLAPSQPPTRKK